MPVDYDNEPTFTCVCAKKTIVAKERMNEATSERKNSEKYKTNDSENMIIMAFCFFFFKRCYAVKCVSLSHNSS